MPYNTFPRPLTTLVAVAAGAWGDSHRKQISRIPQLKPPEDERKFLGKMLVGCSDVSSEGR